MAATKKTTPRKTTTRRPSTRAQRAPAVTETIRTPDPTGRLDPPDLSDAITAEVAAEETKWIEVEVEGLVFRCLPLTEWPGRVYDAIVDQGSLSVFPSLTHPDDQGWFQEEWADLSVGARKRIIDAVMEALGQSLGGSRASRRASARGRRR
jgi:hypothetical protein